jgi:predicted ester cyclase
MHEFTVLFSVSALAGLFAVAPAAAQTGTPAAGSRGAMGVEQTRAVMEPYLAALVAREDIAPFLADDVVLTLVEFGQEIEGRAAVAGAIDELHQETFDASPEIKTLVVGDGVAAGEFVFVGTHTGEFAGIAATGRQVRVPYTVFYDLADDQITALRIQGFASGLVAQLTAEATPTS